MVIPALTPMTSMTFSGCCHESRSAPEGTWPKRGSSKTQRAMTQRTVLICSLFFIGLPSLFAGYRDGQVEGDLPHPVRAFSPDPEEAGARHRPVGRVAAPRLGRPEDETQ